jgi:TM2 domain-containing membrane protein YozV
MSTRDEKYCPYCGTLIPYLDEWCPSCNKLQPSMPGMAPRVEKPDKKVWIAVLASLLITGLGQVYVGEWRKGIAFFVGTFSLGYMLSYYIDYSTIMLFGTVMAIISAYDAYLTLMKRQRRGY